jgi:murein DD-endopeptidase MepM/ murein hydrolase activator NlpD
MGTMKSIKLAAVLLPLLAAAGAQAADTEIRFCPASVIHAYPLSNRAEGLLLQNAAVINHGAPLTVSQIDIQLLDKGVVQEERHIAGEALTKTASSGPAVQKSGMMQTASFQFCGTDMIAPGITLAGPDLKAQQALLVLYQAFAYRGARDALRVAVTAKQDGRDVRFSADIPVRADFAKNSYIFPLRGISYAGAGPTFHTGHRWGVPEEFAFDIGRIGASGTTHSGDGSRFADYYAYGAEILAAADGKVVAASDGLKEDASAMRKPGEAQEAYMQRLMADQAARLAGGVAAVAGNYIVIDHGGSEYSLYAHLQPGSLRVHAGDAVRQGQAIAKLGSSGNSTEPHLHFQLCDRPNPLMCAGIPVQFTNVELPWADMPRPVQSGDIVVAR